MMTEDEAKTKWCPMARNLGTLLQAAKPGDKDYVVACGSQNRGYAMGGPLYNSLCIGSACMAWRWAREPDPADDHPFIEKFVSVRGYCGAFGRPE